MVYSGWNGGPKRSSDNPYEQELGITIKEKLDQQLFEVSMRVLVASPDGGDNHTRLNAIVSSFSTFSSTYQHITARKVLPFITSADRWITRFHNRSLLCHVVSQQTILSSSELSDLYHFPNTDLTKTEGLVKSRSRELAAPLSIKRSELFMHVNGYIVHQKDLPTIKEWCADKKFYNRTLPEPHDESGAIFLKEMTISAAYREVAAPYQANWVKKSEETPFDVLPPIEGYSGSSFETDETSKGVRIYAPSVPLQKILKLQPSEKIGEYVSRDGKIRMFDPSVDYSGVYSSLLVNKDHFLKELAKRGLTVMWTVLGEKLYIGSAYNDEYRGQRLEMHGYCYFDENGRLVEDVRFKNEWKND